MTHHLDPSAERQALHTLETLVLDPSLRPTCQHRESIETRTPTRNRTKSIYRRALPTHRAHRGEKLVREPNSTPISTPSAASTPSNRNPSEASPNIEQCQCPTCKKSSKHPQKTLHDRINLLLSRLDEQQRRWFVALLAEQLGRGGIQKMSEITGMHPDTIRRGRKELERGLIDRPEGRTRLRGGGRRTKQ